jgi:hypothetical protein
MDLPSYLTAHLTASAASIGAAREHLLCRHPLAAAAAWGVPPEPLDACAARLAQQVLQHALQSPPPPPATPRLCLYLCNEVMLCAAAPPALQPPPPPHLPPPPHAWLQALAGALREQLPALLRSAAAAEPALSAHYLPRLLGEWEARGLLGGARELAAACWGALAGSGSALLPPPPPPPPQQQQQQPQQQQPPLDLTLLLPPGTLANALRLGAAQGVPPYTPLPFLGALAAAPAPAVEPGRLQVRLEDFRARLASGEFARAQGAPAAAAVQLAAGAGAGAGGRRAAYGAYLAGSTARYDRFFADGDEAALQVGLKMGLVAPGAGAGAGAGSSASSGGPGERAGLGMH